eukprot:INCI1395.1.p1 GENE.INCI1395.1~~INCI1395.1.p1  ORF type:complete len:709 (-),score=99.34 INCI1395.1:867-2993(-)
MEPAHSPAATERGGATRGSGGLEAGKSQGSSAALALAALFKHAPTAQVGWRQFEDLPDWTVRELAVQRIYAAGRVATLNYAACYKQALDGIILDEFYSASAEFWADVYRRKGEINVPFLNPAALPMLTAYAQRVERLGKNRYGQPRTCYPPGEVARHFSADDPRASLTTDVNMTAIGAGQMSTAAAAQRAPRHVASLDNVHVLRCASKKTRYLVASSPIQWIYHSPHLREFLRQTIGCQSLHPYLSDLGVAVNIMRAPGDLAEPLAPTGGNQMALGFHFDSINSSIRRNDSEVQTDYPAVDVSLSQARGVTGVIGIHDCLCGGERVVFSSINRAKVDDVQTVLKCFDPLRPGTAIGSHKPEIFSGPTAGFLYLFDGGDVLHAVSQVRQGTRIAAVFLFQEDSAPEDSAHGEEACKFFYGDQRHGAADHGSTTTRFDYECCAAKPRCHQSKEVYTFGKYDAVYQQSSPDLYDEWALDGYDEAVAAKSVAVRSVCFVLRQAIHQAYVGLKRSMLPVAQQQKKRPWLVLDAGCGTGRVAEVFVEAQCQNFQAPGMLMFDGVDYSSGMLGICSTKQGLYRRLMQADLTQPLSHAARIFAAAPVPGTGRVAECNRSHNFSDGLYDGVVSSGTFLQGHVGPEALPELCRVIRPGGFMVFSVRPNFFNATHDIWLTTLAASGMGRVEIEMLPYDASGLLAPIVRCFKTPARRARM